MSAAAECGPKTDKFDVYRSCSLCGESENDLSYAKAEKFSINDIPSCWHRFCDRCTQGQFRLRKRFKCPQCNSDVAPEQVCLLDIICGRGVLLN
jgi:hypothetical protein